MRLINTATLQLEDGFDSKECTYAILSHTWSDDEVSLQELANPEKRQKSRGFQKIIECCQLAQAGGIGHAWVDTCCIDKTNSVELSEAIQSMFVWSEDAAVCYAFLEDLPKDISTDQLISSNVHLKDCRWFQRGWTLQELLAPHIMIFFNERLQAVGTRDELADSISSVTGIPEEYLTKKQRVSEACVAQRMSWASRRETTRHEDIAYCLVGIFDVNMTLFYGEGRKKAFLRLQEQIIALSDDETIFAWKRQPGCDTDESCRGILAVDPVEFCDGGCLRVFDRYPRPQYGFSNTGLLFPVPRQANQRRLGCLDIGLNCSIIRTRTPRTGAMSLGGSPEVIEHHEDADRDDDFEYDIMCIRIRRAYKNSREVWYRDEASKLFVARWKYTLLNCVVREVGSAGYNPVRIARSNPDRRFRISADLHLQFEHGKGSMLGVPVLRSMVLYLAPMCAATLLCWQAFTLTMHARQSAGDSTHEWSATRPTVLMLLSWVCFMVGWSNLRLSPWHLFSISWLGAAVLWSGPGSHQIIGRIVIFASVISGLYHILTEQ